jgi:IQ calmodulin-binding motif
MKRNQSKVSLASSRKSVGTVLQPKEIHETITIDGLLGVMASSVIDNNLFFSVPEIPDKIPDNGKFVPQKPPREIFYRNTLLFGTTTISDPLPPEICNCHVCCKPPGDVATYKCLSCSLFDSTGTCFFCDACFKYSHPWHRAPHIFVKIDDDEAIERTVQVANRRTEITRREAEGKKVMQFVNEIGDSMKRIADDDIVEDKMYDYGRRAVSLEERVLEMRKRLQADIAQTVGVVAKHEQRLKTKQMLLDSWQQLEDSRKESEKSNNQQVVSSSSAGSGKPSSKKAVMLVDSNHHTSGQGQQIQEKEHKREQVPAVGPPASPRLVKAALTIQRYLRGYVTRRVMSNYLVERTVRVFDPDAGRGKYTSAEYVSALFPRSLCVILPIQVFS